METIDMATRNKSNNNANTKPQEVEAKKCTLLHNVIQAFSLCVSDGSYRRCQYCSYERPNGCAGNRRRDAAALLKCVNVESIKFRCIPIIYIDGDNETTVYRPYLGYRIKSERPYWQRYGKGNCLTLKTTEGIIYKENLIKGIECCFPLDERTIHPNCQNCPYHALGCDEIMDLQILAFLTSITDSDVDEEALDAIMHPPRPIDPETGMIIGSTEYLNYMDAIFVLED